LKDSLNRAGSIEDNSERLLTSPAFKPVCPPNKLLRLNPPLNNPPVPAAPPNEVPVPIPPINGLPAPLAPEPNIEVPRLERLPRS